MISGTTKKKYVTTIGIECHVQLNTVTKLFSNQAGENILVNSVCPGWVKTEMGGSGATRTLEQGISGIIWAATLPNDGPNGSFFRDGKKREW